MNFFTELKRRNVFKVASVYLVTSWVLLQIIAVITPALQLPAMFATIATVILGLGFPLVCIFAWAFELTPEGMKFTKDVDENESIRHETGQKINALLMVATTLLLGFIIYDKFFTFQIDEDIELSIAVLPFQDMSPDGSQEYFGDGIAEEILNSLARLNKMLVISRTSSFKFKNKNDDIRKIGELLNANYVLEGSVRKDKDMVRITAQLIEVKSGVHLWSQTYDRELKSIFSLQDELTYAITQALKLNLLPEDIKTDNGMTANQHAYDLFLKGRNLGYQRNATAIKQAIHYLNQAIELDPEFYLAKAQLLFVHQLSIRYAGVEQKVASDAMTDLYHQLTATNQNFPLKTAAKAQHLYQVLNKPELASSLFAIAKQQAPSDSIINNASLSFSIFSNKLTMKAMVKERLVFDKVNPMDEVNLANLIIYNYWLGDKQKTEELLARLEKQSPLHSLNAAMQVRHLVIQQPAAALEYLDNFMGELAPETKIRHIELLLTMGRVKQAAEVLAQYIHQHPASIDTYLESYAHILYEIQNHPTGYPDVQEQLNNLPFTDQAKNNAGQMVNLLNGHWDTFIKDMDEQNLDTNAMLALFREDFAGSGFARAFVYAIIKKVQGDGQYATALLTDNLVQSIVLQCQESQIYVGICPATLYLADTYDINELLSYTKANLEGSYLGHFEKRYLLSSPYWYMLHGHPEFKAMAEDYLDNTFRRWREQKLASNLTD